MRTISTAAQEFNIAGLRMDASFYASLGVQTMRLLENWKRSGKQRRFDRLADVCAPKGIFIPGRFSRVYVSDPEHGLPWLSPSDMLKSDLSDVPYVSKKYTPMQDVLRLQKGWLLLSRSGSIGNLAYVRDDMAGMIGSDDIIRILPDNQKIPSGYLFAFLSSLMGKALIQQQTYGAVIQHIEADHVLNLPIPRLDLDAEKRIHALIEKSANLWSNAAKKILQAQHFFAYLLTSEVKEYYPHNHDVSIITFKEMENRLGAHYHSRIYRQLEKDIRKRAYRELGNLSSKLFTPPPFKHIYLSTPNHYPFITGGELVNKRFNEIRYLSRYGMDDINDYVVKEGSLAIYKSGQLDSMLGTVFYIDRVLDGFCLSDHVIRVFIDQTQIHPMYVYAFLSTRIGRLLIIKRAMGKSVPFVREDTVATIPIPILGHDQQKSIVDLINDAFSMRQESLKLEDQAQTALGKALNS